MQSTKDTFSLIEMTEILIKHKKIHEGLYNISIEYKIAVGTVGPAEEKLPGTMIGVSGVGITKTEEENTNTHTVDAAKVNPVPRKKAKKGTA